MLAAAGIGLGHYLTVGAILFTLGVFGIFLNRKNIIIILMSVELILLAVNINFVAFSAYLGDLVGQVLYTRYVFLFQGAAAVLLVAMVGAIVLTLQHKPNVKRQNIAHQVGRKRSEGVELVKVKSGQGV